jgi:hypothetical protein
MRRSNRHERGFLLQDLLNRLLLLHGIAVLHAFTRNAGGEQIDAAFEMDGWHYIVECRCRAKLADIRELDGLAGQVARSGRPTMRLFLSINGWSANVVPLLTQNPGKSMVLMEVMDLRTVLSVAVDLRRLRSPPAEDSGSGRWSVDHLLVDQDGIVEVERQSDTRLRREVLRRRWRVDLSSFRS